MTEVYGLLQRLLIIGIVIFTIIYLLAPIILILQLRNMRYLAELATMRLREMFLIQQRMEKSIEEHIEWRHAVKVQEDQTGRLD